MLCSVLQRCLALLHFIPTFDPHTHGRTSPYSLAHLVEAEPYADEDSPRTCTYSVAFPRSILLMTNPMVQVMDVAQALANVVPMKALPGTFNLPGPSTLTYEYLLTLVSTITYNPPSRAPTVPKKVALALAKAAQSAWWPMLSPDEVERRYISDVEVPGDWDKFGITPDEIEEHAITYLRRYRSACVLSLLPRLRFSRRVAPTAPARVQIGRTRSGSGVAWRWLRAGFVADAGPAHRDNFARPVVFPASREASSVRPSTQRAL